MDDLSKCVTFMMEVGDLKTLKMWVDILDADYADKNVVLDLDACVPKLQVCEYIDNEGVLQRVEIEIVKGD